MRFEPHTEVFKIALFARTPEHFRQRAEAWEEHIFGLPAKVEQLAPQIGLPTDDMARRPDAQALGQRLEHVGVPYAADAEVPGLLGRI